MENIKHITNLIRLIFAKAELSELIKSGLRYSQISQLLEKAIELEYIESKEGGFIVTNKGLSLIHKKSSSDHTGRGWLRPLEDRKTEKIDLMSIYLPSKVTVRKLVAATSASGLRHRGGESSS